MYAGIVIVTGLAQILLLANRAPWNWGVAGGCCIVAILAMLAWTRLRWDPHLDMHLLMMGPGGAAMALSPRTAMCHSTGADFWTMSFWMTAATLPLCWSLARCVRRARDKGHGVQSVAIDAAGMLAGMAAAHFAMRLLPASIDPRVQWLHHGAMLVGMTLGMLAVLPVYSATPIWLNIHAYWKAVSFKRS